MYNIVKQIFNDKILISLLSLLIIWNGVLVLCIFTLIILIH